jgi:hypothetical protein
MLFLSARFDKQSPGITLNLKRALCFNGVIAEAVMTTRIKIRNKIPGTWRAARPFLCGALFILTASVLTSGCVSDFGRYQMSNEVRRSFESYQVLPGYKYYYAGLQDRPDAILGIDRHYTLDNALWSEIDLTSAQLRAWIGHLARPGSSRLMAFGYYILDPAGKRIGVWYSRFRGVPVKMEPGNRIVAYALLEKPVSSGGDGK